MNAIRLEYRITPDEEIIQIVADYFGVTFEEVEEAYNKASRR
ncbi:hypothetical protein [Jeotgalibacillus marinus]|uniref:Uncharacterized protein n=1 Tax=Jeotgalibacillus marinus TaxID=86667 RepID=A0ABV3PYY8_9BACL